MPSIDVIVVSGPQGPVGPAGATVSGSTSFTGQYPIFYDAGSGLVGIYSGAYVTPANLLSASGDLVAQIQGSGSTPAPSGYATGLFTGPTNSSPLLRSTTGQRVEILGAGASGSSPSSTNLSMLVVQPIHGSTGNLLGEPDGWWSILVSGRSARVPYYYAS